MLEKIEIGKVLRFNVAVGHGKCFDRALPRAASLQLWPRSSTPPRASAAKHSRPVSLIPGYSVREFTEACRRVTGADIIVKEHPRRPGDAAEVFADASAIKKVSSQPCNRCTPDAMPLVRARDRLFVAAAGPRLEGRACQP